MERKQEIITQIENLKAQIESGVSMHAEGTYRQQIAELEKEMAQIEETEAREQKTEELLDVYNDQLSHIFSTLFPEDKFKVLLGVNEYENLRQDYKRVHKALHAGQVEQINVEHTVEIGSWREKFGRLTDQAQETENQLAEQKEFTHKYHNQVLDLTVERDEALADLGTLKLQMKLREEEIEKGKYAELENVKLRQQIVELENKIESISKPKEPVKTEALDNVLNEIKSRKQMDPDDLMRRFEARQQNGPKVMAIDHGAKNNELPELPFRPEMVAPALEQGPVALPTVESQFQDQGNQPSGLPVLNDGAGPRVAIATIEQTVDKTIEERVWQLECDTSRQHDWIREIAERMSKLDGKPIISEDVA